MVLFDYLKLQLIRQRGRFNGLGKRYTQCPELEDT